MENIDKKHSIEFLKTLLKTESISGSEREISNILKAFLRENNFKLLNSRVGNVIGIKGSGSPILLLASHMDTVPTNNPYREEDNKIYATGAVDCKPSLASMFMAGKYFNELNENEGTLIVAGIIEEETSTRGMLDLFDVLERENITPDFAVFGEPTGIDRICIGYRGRILIHLLVEGKPGHASSNWGFDNAIEIIMAIYLKIKDYIKSRNKLLKSANNNTINTPKSKENPDTKLASKSSAERSRFYTTSCTITRIEGGTADNTIPGHAGASIDIRIPPGQDSTQISQTLSFIIEGMKHTKKGEIPYPVPENLPLQSETRIKHEIAARYEGVEINQNSIVVNALRWAAFKTLKKKIRLLRKTGSTFMNIIQEHYSKVNPDFACIVYGPGDPRLEHTDHEFIDLDEYLNAIRIYTLFFGKFSELFRKSKIK